LLQKRLGVQGTSGDSIVCISPQFGKEGPKGAK